MNLGNYTIHVVLTILGSVGFGSLVSWVANRGKTKAEASDKFADAYGKLIDDLREQMKFQGEQITNQSQQISTMQARELEYLKIINQHHEEKKQLIEKHSKIEAELKKQIQDLEKKLAMRITKIENNLQ